jgi:hypothetical protein
MSRFGSSDCRCPSHLFCFELSFSSVVQSALVACDAVAHLPPAITHVF